jgi:hypothetical protein
VAGEVAGEVAPGEVDAMGEAADTDGTVCCGDELAASAGTAASAS